MSLSVGAAVQTESATSFPQYTEARLTIPGTRVSTIVEEGSSDFSSDPTHPTDVHEEYSVLTVSNEQSTRPEADEDAVPSQAIGSPTEQLTYIVDEDVPAKSDPAETNVTEDSFIPSDKNECDPITEALIDEARTRGSFVNALQIMRKGGTVSVSQTPYETSGKWQVCTTDEDGSRHYGEVDAATANRIAKMIRQARMAMSFSAPDLTNHPAISPAQSPTTPTSPGSPSKTRFAEKLSSLLKPGTVIKRALSAPGSRTTSPPRSVTSALNVASLVATSVVRTGTSPSSASPDSTRRNSYQDLLRQNRIRPSDV